MKLSFLLAPLIIATATAAVSQPTELAASAPEHHETAYAQFKQALDQQAKDNSYDPCPAISIALNATNDELCIDSWMERAATDGNPVALQFTGARNLYYVPDGQKNSPAVRASVAKIKKAADKKYTPAMVEYSTFMRNGVGVPKNSAGADRMLMEACRTGNFETRFSWLLQTDRLMKYEDKDRPEVKSEIKRGNHHVLFYLSGKAPNRYIMFTMLAHAARLGNHSALYELSAHLSKANPQISYHYLKAAAALHNPMALRTLGEYLVAGNHEVAEVLGIQQDPAAGIHLLKIAAMLGDTTAYAHLSHIYYHGLYGIPKAPDRAYKHIEIGAMARPDVGFMTAQGYMLMKGEGVAQDSEKGLALIKAAAAQKFPYGVAMLAYVYFRGIGVATDPKEAIYRLEALATTPGLDICFVYLALIYDEGAEGLEKDPKKSQYYLDHAKRRLGDYAQNVFDHHKNELKGWTLSPFDIPV